MDPERNLKVEPVLSYSQGLSEPCESAPMTSSLQFLTLCSEKQYETIGSWKAGLGFPRRFWCFLALCPSPPVLHETCLKDFLKFCLLNTNLKLTYFTKLITRLNLRDLFCVTWHMEGLMRDLENFLSRHLALLKMKKKFCNFISTLFLRISHFLYS